MKIRSVVSSGANSSFSDGQLGSYKRKCTSLCSEGSRNDLKERMLPKDFTQTLLTYSNNGQPKVLNDLPQEIITDIISRLPFESILGSKLVCVKWYQVTKDPYFIKLQVTRSKPKLLFQPFVKSLNHLTLVDNEGEGEGEGEVHNFSQIPVTELLTRLFWIKCSYNGLLCMATRDQKADPLMIYNPLTRVFMELPKSELKRVLSHYVVSLGSASNGRYKILRHYTQKRGTKERRFEILSLGESSWRQISEPEPNWYACNSIFHNGVFFIIMKKFRDWKMCITAIDATSEKIQIIPFQKERIHLSSVELSEVDGRLTILTTFRDEKSTYEFFGNKVGEFSVQLMERLYFRTGTLGTYFHDNRIGYELKGGKFLRQTTWSQHYEFFPYEENSIMHKRFHYNPSFVNPLADALLSWPKEQVVQSSAQS